MKIELFINWDYLGLMIAMVLYPAWCCIEYICTIIHGVKKWAEKQ